MQRNYLIESAGADEPFFKTVKDVINHLEIQLNNNAVEKEIQSLLSSTVAQLFHATLNSPDGYCIKFNIPLIGVTSCYKKLNLVISSVETAFRNDWLYPKGTRMYSD